MVFENGVKKLQAAAYNGARTVNILLFTLLISVVNFPLQNVANTELFSINWS